MKFFSIILCFLLSTSSFGQELYWSPVKKVADGYGNLRPRITLLSNDVPAVTWGGGTGHDVIYYSRMLTDTFSTPIAITPNGVVPYATFWVGPDIASHGDTVWIVFDANVNNGFNVFTVKSEDGGISFGDTVNVNGNNGLSRFPAIGADEFGNLSVTYMDHDSGWLNPRYVATKSLTGGNSWETSVDVSSSFSGTEVCDCCPAEIILSGTKSAVLFRNNDNNLRDMWASFSPNTGSSYTIASDIDEGNWIISACPSSGGDGVFVNDSLLAVWMTGGSGSSKVMIAKVDPVSGNASVNQAMPVQSGGTQNYPRIAANNNTVGIVYQEYVSGSTECFFAYSFSGSIRPDTAVFLNEETLGHQQNPDVVFSNGIFHFVWQDNGNGDVMYRTASISAAGINENTRSFSLYPNPITNHFIVQGEPGNKLQIVNQEGKIVLDRSSIQATELVDCSQLSSGIYFVQVSSKDKKTATKKIIISR